MPFTGFKVRAWGWWTKKDNSKHRILWRPRSCPKKIAMGVNSIFQHGHRLRSAFDPWTRKPKIEMAYSYGTKWMTDCNVSLSASMSVDTVVWASWKFGGLMTLITSKSVAGPSYPAARQRLLNFLSVIWQGQRTNINYRWKNIELSGFCSNSFHLYATETLFVNFYSWGNIDSLFNDVEK